MEPSTFFWLNPLILGCVFIALGIPLALQRIRPNRYYGFRTAKTRSNPAIWYRANAYAGKAFIVSGLVTLAGALFLRTYIRHPGLSHGHATVLMSCIEFGPVLAAIVVSAVYASRI